MNQNHRIEAPYHDLDILYFLSFDIMVLDILKFSNIFIIAVLYYESTITERLMQVYKEKVEWQASFVRNTTCKV